MTDREPTRDDLLRELQRAQEENAELKAKVSAETSDAAPASNGVDSSREDLLRGILEGTTDALFAKDLEGHYLLINSAGAKLLGREIDEIIGRVDDDLFPPEEVPEIQRIDRQVMTTGEPHTFEETVTFQDRPVTLYTAKTAYRDANGKVAGLIGIARDISRRKEIEAELERHRDSLEEIVTDRTDELVKLTHRLKLEIVERQLAAEERKKIEMRMQHAQRLESLGLIAGGVAHDFNNLLVSIMGNAELAAEDLAGSSPIQKNLEGIGMAAKCAADLCQQLLAYSGQGSFVVRPFDLAQTLGDMGSLMKVSIAKEVELKYDLADDVPPISGDGSQLRQVIMNLITNASEAIGSAPGRITITAGVADYTAEELATFSLSEGLRADPYAFISIADTGCGMSAETVKKIFDPFFTTKFAGRGLGLAASLGIVRSHHGAIRVKSVPDEGTTFTILLPIRSCEAADPEPVETAADWHPEGKALLVEDEETVRAVVRMMLGHIGFAVLTAATAHEGLELFRANKDEISLVVVDVTMPQMSGPELREKIREIDAEKPILLTSGFSPSQLTEILAEDEHAEFVQKPFELDTLERLAHGMLHASDPA